MGIEYGIWFPFWMSANENFQYMLNFLCVNTGEKNFAQDKFRLTNFVTRNSHQNFPDSFKKTHQIFPAQNLSFQKSSAPLAPFPLFLMYSLMSPRKKPPNFYGWF
jgi:hypothetical protein